MEKGGMEMRSFAEALLARECLIIDFWFDSSWGNFECTLLLSIWLWGCVRCQTGPGTFLKRSRGWLLRFWGNISLLIAQLAHQSKKGSRAWGHCALAGAGLSPMTPRSKEGWPSTASVFISIGVSEILIGQKNHTLICQSIIYCKKKSLRLLLFSWVFMIE